MKIVSVAVRSFKGTLSHQSHFLRNLSTWAFQGNGTANNQVNKSESPEEFELRIFSPRGNSKTDAILDKLNQQQARNRDRSAGNTQLLDDLERTFDTLSDGMDGKLNNAARCFEFDPEEIDKVDYSYRHDTTFQTGSKYDLKDLDLTKPAAQKFPKRGEIIVSTNEVLSQADFRNVRFLGNFITEAGILIKRSKTGISAKAQRKVAREIKTARAFGLMPFTTMGTKPFKHGRTMENLDDDYSYRSEMRNMPSELNQQRTRERSAGNTQLLDDLERTCDTLYDGMDEKLKNAARYFEFDPDEIDKADNSYRHDTTFHHGSKYDVYDVKHLDLTKPAARKNPTWGEFIVSTSLSSRFQGNKNEDCFSCS